MHVPKYNLHEPENNLHNPECNLHEPEDNLHEPEYNLYEKNITCMNCKSSNEPIRAKQITWSSSVIGLES